MLNNKKILKGLAVASGVTIGLLATGASVSANSGRPYDTNQNLQTNASSVRKLETYSKNINAPHNQLNNQRAQLGTYVKSHQETGQIHPVARVIYPQASNNYDQANINNNNSNNIVHFNDENSYNNQNNINNTSQPLTHNDKKVDSNFGHIGNIVKKPNKNTPQNKLDSGYAKFLTKFNTLNSVYDHNLSIKHPNRAIIKPKVHKFSKHYDRIIRKNKVYHLIKYHHVSNRNNHVKRGKIQRYSIKRIRSIERRKAWLTHQQHMNSIRRQVHHVSMNHNAIRINHAKRITRTKHAEKAKYNWFTDGLSKRQLAARNWISWHESGHHWYILSYGHRCIGYFQLDPAYLGYKHGHVNLNPHHQVKVADRYVRNRYGTWHKAQVFWEYHHWY